MPNNAPDVVFFIGDSQSMVASVTCGSVGVVLL